MWIGLGGRIHVAWIRIIHSTSPYLVNYGWNVELTKTR
jgi:hypothetical protein